MTHHGIIFVGVNYPDSARKGGGATRISNFCKPHGWNIDVVEYFPFWSESQLALFLSKEITPSSKFIGFSYTWLSQYKGFSERVKFIKDLYPNLLIIVGGQTPFQENLYADYYVYG
ncbi:MAG: hypothetical protein ACK55I_49865, partial [bacterium]